MTNVDFNERFVYCSANVMTIGTTYGTAFSGASIETPLVIRAADYMAFNTGAPGFSEAMRIDSDGNVGIGTTSPSSGCHLTVANTSASTCTPLFVYGNGSAGMNTSIKIGPSYGTYNTEIGYKRDDYAYMMHGRSTGNRFMISQSGNFTIGGSTY